MLVAWSCAAFHQQFLCITSLWCVQQESCDLRLGSPRTRSGGKVTKKMSKKWWFLNLRIPHKKNAPEWHCIQSQNISGGQLSIFGLDFDFFDAKTSSLDFDKKISSSENHMDFYRISLCNLYDIFGIWLTKSSKSDSKKSKQSPEEAKPKLSQISNSSLVQGRLSLNHTFGSPGNLSHPQSFSAPALGTQATWVIHNHGFPGNFMNLSHPRSFSTSALASQTIWAIHKHFHPSPNFPRNLSHPQSFWPQPWLSRQLELSVIILGPGPGSPGSLNHP